MSQGDSPPGSFTETRKNFNKDVEEMYEVAHLALVVKDCERSTDFYSQVLGFTVQDSFTNEALKIIYLQSGPLTIELLEYIPAPSTQRGTGIYDHIAFSVPDIGLAISRLKEQGIEFESDQPRLVMDGKRIIFLTGPDGERIELMEA